MFTKEQKRLLNKLSQIDDIDEQIKSLFERTNENIQEVTKIEQDISKIIKEKTKGFPWLADTIAQYYEVRDLKISEFLEHKLRPAISSADRVLSLIHISEPTRPY